MVQSRQLAARSIVFGFLKAKRKGDFVMSRVDFMTAEDSLHRWNNFPYRLARLHQSDSSWL